MANNRTKHRREARKRAKERRARQEACWATHPREVYRAQQINDLFKAIYSPVILEALFERGDLYRKLRG